MYAYCNGDWVNNTDPSGLRVDYDKNDARMSWIFDQIRKLPGGQEMYDELNRSSRVYKVVLDDSRAPHNASTPKYPLEANIVTFVNKTRYNDSTSSWALLGSTIAHEMVHAFVHLKSLDNSVTQETYAEVFGQMFYGKNGGSLAELTKFENKFPGKTGVDLLSMYTTFHKPNMSLQSKMSAIDARYRSIGQFLPQTDTVTSTNPIFKLWMR
jgi:hypothetical protein